MTFASELGMPNDSPVYPHLLVPFMFMAYDYLLTWDDEVKYVWMWSPKGSNHWLKWVPTTIYLMLRYFGTAFVFFSMIRTCLPPVPTGQWDPLLIGYTQGSTLCLTDTVVGDIGLIVQFWISDVTFWLGQIILQRRLYVLHKRSEKVLKIMRYAFITEVIVMIGVMTYISVTLKNASSTVQVENILPQILFLKYSILGFYNFVLFCLAILAGIQLSKDDLRIGPVNHGGVSLRDVVIKGNIVYFYVNSLVVSVGIILYASTGLQSVLLAWDQLTIAVAAISACRLILRIRRQGLPSSNPSDIELPAMEYRIPDANDTASV